MGKLAIHGGSKVLPGGLSADWPRFDKTDEKALLKVFRSGVWWRGGTIEQQAAGECGRFERAFAEYQGAKHGLGVCNGTIALELALRCAGVRAGDEVIVPDLSFVVTASAVLPIGAVAVFADSDPETFQVDPDAIEAAITPRTTCICIVHFGGYPADMDRIARIARKHKLALVEDCAHAHGTQWRGRGAGTFGRFGTFSFQQFKALTCGEGGLVVARTLGDWRKLYRYHHLGRLESKGFYEFHEMSSNYRLTDLQGALLNTQLAKLKKQIPVKMRAAAFLSKRLRQIGGLEPLPDDKRITRRGYYYYILKYDPAAFKGLDRETFRDAMAAEGAPVGKGYGSAIHTYPLFANMKLPARCTKSRYRKVRCPATERIVRESLCTLIHTTLLADRATLGRIADAVAKIKDNVDELLPRRTARSRRSR